MSRGSVSHRSLVTSRGGSRTSSNSNNRGSSNTKCIVTVGIILPLLAAIIGVAAWSVSGDSVHRRAPPTTVYHVSGEMRKIGHPSYRHGDAIFEERNDGDDLLFGQKIPIGESVSKDVLGPAIEEERDILPPSTDAPAGKDPLYVVHYVPRGRQAQETSTESVEPSPAPDVLSKILQAGKGSGKGTPQFVVFAPMANEEDDADDRNMDISRKKTRKRKKPRKEDYDYEDEYTENTQVRQQKAPVPVVPRHGFYDTQPDLQAGWQNFNSQSAPSNCHGCSGGGGSSGGMMPSGMMSTEAPKQGITITLGNGLPLGPLGILRQILRPKVDLKKKLFFGVQLENGIGFGGNNNNGGGQMNQGGMMGGSNTGHGSMGGGNMGNMGGGMRPQGGSNSGGGGSGGGITYTFGK